jgi:hypothetical protein
MCHFKGEKVMSKLGDELAYPFLEEVETSFDIYDKGRNDGINFALDAIDGMGAKND